MKKSNLGFSLIELMIVIGIILLLAGLLTLAISGGQQKGNQTQCMHNLRTFGAELVKYTDESGGRFPIKTDVEDYAAWFNILPQRLGSTRMADLTLPKDDEFPERIPNDQNFICPSMPYERQSGQKYYSSYAINADLVSLGKKARYQNIKDPAHFVFLCETPTPNKPKVDLDTLKENQNSYIHNGKTTVCFADGHAQSVSKQEMEKEKSIFVWNYKKVSE